MANKILQQYINKTIGDNTGNHMEVKVGATRKKADWLWTYPNKKAIIIEGKESGDSDIKAAKIQLDEYKEILKGDGYDDFITIAAKDLKNEYKFEVYRNETFIGDTLKSLTEYEQILGTKKIIDVSKNIYKIVKDINEMLHHIFMITNLQDRMIFTGTILIAAKIAHGCFENYTGIGGFKTCVKNKLNAEYERIKDKSSKLNELIKKFEGISIGTANNINNDTINMLCDRCDKINKIMDDNPLSDIDIMNIFFTEFNRYRVKSEHGQVFTPDHIAELMSELIDINQDDIILDPTCGSGSLLIKASKLNNKKWENIYGNEIDINILLLSYINMLLHNDGISNFSQYDARNKDFSGWIKCKKINKVVGNPPYENTSAIDILKNVLENIEDKAKVCWLMPNTKMDKKRKLSKEILKTNKCTDIILLPDIFAKVGCGEVSLFIFTKGEPQGDAKIRGWHIPDDGFETIKNEGYKDTKNSWSKIKQNFLEKWKNGKYDKLIDPNTNLSYQEDREVEQVTKEDFEMTLLQYELFKIGNIESQNTVESCFKLMIEFMKVNNLDEKLEFLKKIAKDKNKEDGTEI